MSTIDPGAAVAYPSAAPERLFHVRDVTGDRATATGTMDTGPWVLDAAGLASAGSLGVLIDDVFGMCILHNRPAGRWGVTTELSLTFCGPVPSDGTPITAEAVVVEFGTDSGVARGSVSARDGSVIAVGTQRVRFVDGPVPDLSEVPPSEGIPAGRPLEVTISADGTSTDGDRTVLEFLADAEVANPAGNVHGGVLVYLSETAGLAAVKSEVSTLRAASLQIVFVRPAPIGEVLQFQSEVLHHGRTLAVVQVSCLRADGKVCSLATVTCHQ